MKLFFMLMIGLIDAKKKGGRKVPPRHPLSRLNRLSRRLAPEVLNHPNLDWPVKKQDRVLGKLQAFADRMKTRFESDNCGFYDSSLKHGGPDPNPDVKPNGKPRKPVDDRKRRDADTCEPWEAPKDYWWIKKDSAFMWLYSYCNTDNDYSCGAANDAEIEKREEFLIESTDDLCIDGEACEWFDMTTCTFREIENYKEDLSNTEDEEKIVQGTKVVRGRGGGRKLSDNPQKAWKQVTTGLKKWALRYLNNCYGMRKSKKPANRAKAMYERHVDSFPTSWQ
jgi:hypothetical protein